MPSSAKNCAALNRQGRTLLVIAHPGHELRVHGWLETSRPAVWVLTDGSGRAGRSRIASTSRVIEAAGAIPGAVYGPMTDIDLYNAVLNLEHFRFTTIVDQLADAAMRNNIECIAGDAQEGYNPGHDICRLVINAAVELVHRKTRRQLLNYDFTLNGEPGDCPDDLREHSVWLDLDNAAFARKLSAARSYLELQAEVEAALMQENSFRVECLRPVSSYRRNLCESKPFYEEYGERQVKAGHYSDVLRYRDHMLPIADALTAHVERSS